MMGDKSIEANNFVTKLKADGSERDLCDLEKVLKDFKNILSNLPAKDHGLLSLNVLCILCRNLNKVPKWSEKISNKALLELSIDCLRQTRMLSKSEQVKTLACMYHIHRSIVRQNQTIPPELILKLSYMPFEVTKEHLLKDYYKTYWSILADRFVYLEKLKTSRLSIIKLLPKLSEDIATIISLYDPVQFCMSILLFIVKKLHVLYNDLCARDLQAIHKSIFNDIATINNLKLFKNIPEKEALDLYVKFNDCLYYIIDNESKIHFKESILDFVIRIMISLLGHNTDIFHCYQTVYSNCFCCIFKEKVNSDYVETVLRNMHSSCETAERLGYQKAMYATYPFIAQLLRLFVEYYVTNASIKKWNEYFDVMVQDKCLKIVIFLAKKLSKTQQISKCDNCNVKTGLHDALRLTFLTQHILNTSISQRLDIAQILPYFFTIVEIQYTILKELNKIGCSNHTKCLRKLQTNVHNAAIIINKASYYKYSIKLFNIYLKNEIQCVKNDADLKNVARALYNKSISELDCQLYDDAIKSAYLSLVFSGAEGLTSDKYMGLVMDIKVKVLKRNDGEKEEDNERFQLMTVLTACKMLAEDRIEYGNLKPFLSTLKFSSLLKYEFSMYVKLWPSVVPIAGVWNSLNHLMKGDHGSWLTAEKEDTLLWCLYEVIIETPTAVRCIHCDHYKATVGELMRRFNENPAKKLEEKIAQATILFLQSEYDIAEATEKYNWKHTEQILDPDQAQVNRTLPQEHRALRYAVDAVRIWTDILPKLNTVPVSPHLQHGLQIAEVFVQQFLHMQRCAHGLQLAHVCCELAQRIGAKEAYLRSAGAILHFVSKRSEQVERIVAVATSHWTELMRSGECLETALVFACDLSMYHRRCGSTVTAAKLLHFVQARLLEAMDKQTDVNLNMAMGRLLEAEAQGTQGFDPSTMSRTNAVHRHYVTLSNPETKWTLRRSRALYLKRSICEGAILVSRFSRDLRLWRRARSAVGSSLPASAALSIVRMYVTLTDGSSDDAQVKIDNRLKHTLGLQPTNEIQAYCQQPQTKVEPFTPKHTYLETVLESVVFKKTQTSPSVPCVTIPAFKMPEFLTHKKICTCYACEEPYAFILALHACTLEASMYYRSKEYDIARNYYAGASEALALCVAKLNVALRNDASMFQKYILDIVRDNYYKEIRYIEVEMLIEAAYFELTQGNNDSVNDKIVRLYEIIQEVDLNKYLYNDVNNLLIATARLRSVSKKNVQLGVELEMENLKLSPNTMLTKTPESKYMPNRNKKIPRKVENDELPIIERKIIKLNLDDESSDEREQIETIKKPHFKIPDLKTAKPVLETITPRPSRTRPKIVISRIKDSKDVSTPSSKGDAEFLTPCASTPGEQFFTPMTSVKTYARKRSGIVKNLESEFSTPKADKNMNQVTEIAGRLRHKRGQRRDRSPQ